MGGSGGRMNGRDGGTHVAREGEMWRLRHITFPQCIKGTGLSVTHTVRTVRGGGDEEGGEKEREGEKGRERRRWRRQRGRG